MFKAFLYVLAFPVRCIQKLLYNKASVDSEYIYLEEEEFFLYAEWPSEKFQQVSFRYKKKAIKYRIPSYKQSNICTNLQQPSPEIEKSLTKSDKSVLSKEVLEIG
jgi:hypothetical protein